MRLPGLRFAYLSKFLHQSPSLLRYNSISSVAQVSTYNSDSGSDEQSSPYSTSLHTNEQFVGLNTHRVTEMIHNLSTQPANAYSLFRQLKSTGYEHNLHTYTAIIRVLCCANMSMQLDSILHEVIQSGKSHLGFDISDVYELFVEEAMKPGAPDSSTRVFDALLKVYISLHMCEEACENFIQTFFQTREKEKGLLHIKTVNYFLNWLIAWNNGEKIEFAVSIYELLKNRSWSPPDVYTYGIMIKANFIRGCPEEAVEVLKDMEVAAVTPNSSTYTIFIEGLCKSGKTDLGYEYLQALRSEKSIPFDVYAYRVVIGGFVKEDNLEKAELVMNEIEELGLFPDQDCYRVLIQGYCDVGDRKKCFDLHSKMLSMGIHTNCIIVSIILQSLYESGKYVKVVKTFKHFNGLRIYLDAVPFIIVVNALCKMKKAEEAMGFVIKKMELNVRIYTSLMNGYLIKKKPREACDIFLEMRSRVTLDEISYRCIAYGLSRNGRERDIKHIFKDMESKGLEPTPDTHKGILEGLCIEGKLEVAQDYISAFVETKSPDIYAATINGCCKSQDEDGAYNAYNLFLKYSNQKLVLTRSCYLKLLKLLCYEGALAEARKVYSFTINCGFHDNSCKIMQRILVEALCRDEDIKAAREVFDSIPAIPDVSTYNILLKGYCRKNLMRHASELLKEMKVNEVEPDVTTYTVLVDKFYKLGNYQKGDRYYKKMLNAGLEPDIAMYQARIAGFLDKPNIHKVVSLFNEMSNVGMYPDKFSIQKIRKGLIKACGIHRRQQTF